MDHSPDHSFRFDLDAAIRDQLVRRLEASPMLALSRNLGPDESGIYALYWKRDLVYVGKATKEVTKSKRTLKTRLNEHVTKVSSRQGIRLDQVLCQFLVFESEWWVFAAEYALIAHYRPKWNQSGFGSKVPGKGRPGTERVSEWNKLFPPI